ncbi:hypothetical protein CPARA_2gp256 (nucleomorph) [Cryptomonas paramecium]|uniref:Transmembrane protein n=1 Tax=Cryptomonas paramaecium TaxID=2898 RepID=F2HHW8_9CRYP|nr:hypothetical protein CPARA_2gp256 [Cryptomonas paramecium]AEA38914.1 hypothetical protein CPARA_2gp256 [Cryptomonas paramecium]
MVKCQVDVCSFYFYKYFYFEKNAFDFFRFIKKNFFHCKKALKNSLMVKVTDYSTCKFLKNPATIIKLKYFKKKKIVLNCKNIISSFNFQLSYVLTNFFVGFSYITKIIFYIMFGVNLEYLQAIVFFLKNSHNITKQSIIFFNILVFKKAFSLTSSVFNYTKKAYWLCSGEFFFFQKLFFANFIQTVVKKKNFHICYQFIEICLKALKFFKISSVIIQSIFTKIVMKHELDLFLIKNKKMCFNLFFYKIFQDRLSIVIFFLKKFHVFFIMINLVKLIFFPSSPFI